MEKVFEVFVTVMCVVLVGILVVVLFWVSGLAYHSLNEGAAKSRIANQLYGFEIPEADARHINIVMTSTDVAVSIDQFTVLEGN